LVLSSVVYTVELLESLYQVSITFVILSINARTKAQQQTNTLFASFVSFSFSFLYVLFFRCRSLFVFVFVFVCVFELYPFYTILLGRAVCNCDRYCAFSVFFVFCVLCVCVFSSVPPASFKSCAATCYLLLCPHAFYFSHSHTHFILLFICFFFFFFFFFCSVYICIICGPVPLLHCFVCLFFFVLCFPLLPPPYLRTHTHPLTPPNPIPFSIHHKHRQKETNKKPTTMDKLLDFSQPFDVHLFDECVGAFYQGNAPPQIQNILVSFQQHDQAWTRVHDILQHSQNPSSKIIALNILADTVSKRWKILPAQQTTGIRTFVIQTAVKLSSTRESLQQHKATLGRLNRVLVEILKKEWPHNWPTFMQELVASSRRAESVCANNMDVLQILSEEVFDFSQGNLTQEKIRTMKESLNKDFAAVYKLCEYILMNSKDTILVTSTLRTLLRFLRWINVRYIFETKLIELLVLKFFPVSIFQNDTLRCLVEIGSLTLNEHQNYNPIFVKLFMATMSHVMKMITPSTDVTKIFSSGDRKVQEFVRHLAIFVTSFLKAHIKLIEAHNDTARQTLVSALTILLRISQVDDDVVFRICLEYWTTFVIDLYQTKKSAAPAAALLLSGSGALDRPTLPPRLQLYQQTLSRLRLVLISKMAKPEEVLIVQDDNGDWVREHMRDTDSINLYKNMREALIYLTHLDPVDTQDTMLLKLSKQMDQSEWSWHNLNTLCWAIGSISGALTESQERTFLVRVIKDLLALVDVKRTKDNKAVIASNIMYVVGQYPRFLRMHWKFLRTVVNKLFEFMHEKHPGVQDMSCDTYLKIARKCRTKFIVQQPEEPQPFVQTIIDKIADHTRSLEHSQIYTFYEATAVICSSQSDPEMRQLLVTNLMKMPNQLWSSIVTRANSQLDTLWAHDVVKSLSFVLRINIRVASSLGHGFMVQLGRIYTEMLNIYKAYSKYMSTTIAKDGPNATKRYQMQAMRGVKANILNLVKVFVRNSQAAESKTVFEKFLPALIEPVLNDYEQCVPPAREAAVLALFATVIEKFGDQMVERVGLIFDSVFKVTLDMITKNFEDYPDHRIQFFNLLRSINQHCFPSLLKLNAQQFRLVMESISWAFRHLERNVADTGLSILLDLLNNVQNSEVANMFFKAFFINILSDVLDVLTDTFHKQGFRLHAAILAKLFHIIDSGVITVPLWKQNTQFPNNQVFVRDFVVTTLVKVFPNITQQQVQHFAQGLFQLHSNLQGFKEHLRDFLVEIKEFVKDDASGLYREEQETQQQHQQQQLLARTREVPGLEYTGPSANANANASNSSGAAPNDNTMTYD
jgi:exportin-1